MSKNCLICTAPGVQTQEPLSRSTEMETLFDLCVNYGNDAGQGKFITENSRDAMDILLEWANEFNKLHAENDWSETDYIETVDDFYAAKRAAIR